MVITGRDIGGQWPQRVKRRFVTPIELLVHIFFDELHRHMAGPLNHHLHIMLPRDLRQLTQRLQFAQLRRIIGIINRARTQAITQRESNIIGFHNFAYLFKMRVEETFLVMRQTPFSHNRSAA